MTTITARKTSKASKAPKAKAGPKPKAGPQVLNIIADGYSALVNHDGELEFLLMVADLMSEGKASVRSVQDSIASVKGTAPTIRKSHAQWFTIAADILRNHEAEAKVWAVADILKMAERVGRNHGAEKAAGVIEDAQDLADLAEKAPTQTKAKAAKDGAAAPVALTLESVIAGSNDALRKVLQGKNLRDVSTQDLQTLKALIGTLHAIAKNTEARVKA
jgi:hypothetical protein